MADFRFQEMFPHGADATPYRKLDGSMGRRRHVPRRARAHGRRRGAHPARVRGRPRRLAPLPSRPPGAAPDDPRGPGSVDQRPLRRAQHAAQRVHLGGHGAAVVPGHRHRDRHRQEGPARVDERRRRDRRSRAASTTSTSRRASATRSWRRSRRSRRRTPGTNLPAQIEPLRHRRRRVPAASSSPRAAARRTSRFLYPGDAGDS